MQVARQQVAQQRVAQRDAMHTLPLRLRSPAADPPVAAHPGSSAPFGTQAPSAAGPAPICCSRSRQQRRRAVAVVCQASAPSFMSLPSVEGYSEVQAVKGVRVVLVEDLPTVQYLVEWKVRLHAAADGAVASGGGPGTPRNPDPRVHLRAMAADRGPGANVVSCKAASARRIRGLGAMGHWGGAQRHAPDRCSGCMRLRAQGEGQRPVQRPPTQVRGPLVGSGTQGAAGRALLRRTWLRLRTRSDAPKPITARTPAGGL